MDIKYMPMKVISVIDPISEVKVTEILRANQVVTHLIPLFLESVSAGFPSPADDYIEMRLDLNDYLIKNPAATFFVRVTGDSMKNAGIFSGDILVVDKSLDPKDGSVVIAVIDGELTVKRLHRDSNRIFLLPENNNYQPMEITEQMGFEVWGVVRTVIHSVM